VALRAPTSEDRDGLKSEPVPPGKRIVHRPSSAKPAHSVEFPAKTTAYNVEVARGDFHDLRSIDADCAGWSVPVGH